MPNTIQTSAGEVKPRKLGRGLSALLGSEPVRVEVGGPTAATARTPESASKTPPRINGPTDVTTDGRVIELELGAIQPGRFQPRKMFDQAQLDELAASIKSAGLVQPVVVRPIEPRVGGQERYELIAGERRWRAAKIAGLKHLPAVIKRVSDEQAAEWSLIENLQRADLSPMERAEALRSLCERFRLSHQQAAEKLGVDRSSVSNLVRLLELEEPIRSLLEKGELNLGHGKALLSAPAGAGRINLATIAANQGWSVRKLEKAASGAAGTAAGVPAGPIVIQASDKAVARAAALRDLEKQLGEHLGTAVTIRASGSGKRGSIVVKFYDLDHFDGLMNKMGFMLK